MATRKKLGAAAPRTAASAWVWMPHPGHLICARDCRFHLNTYVNGYVVSTVGEYFPDSQVREILAKSRGVTLEGRGDEREADYMRKLGYEPIGCDRLYETMAFKGEAAAPGEGSVCCPWRAIVGEQVDFASYNDADSAASGHRALCAKWASIASAAEPPHE